jgi:hypothetical protein
MKNSDQEALKSKSSCERGRPIDQGDQVNMEIGTLVKVSNEEEEDSLTNPKWVYKNNE